MEPTKPPTTYQTIKKPWNPVEAFFGANVSKMLGDVVKRLGHESVFLVTDKVILEKTGMVSSLAAILDAKGIKKTTWADVQPEPNMEVAENITHAIRGGEYDCVVGLGGGSVLDMAKVAAAMYTHQGEPNHYLGANKFQGKVLDLVLIPTTAGTGSELTNRAMVTADEKAVIASDSLYAKVALVDPLLTLTLPPKVTADTGFDALSHSIEGIMSNEKFEGVEEVEKSGCEAAKLIMENIREATFEGDNTEARTQMMYAALLSGFVLSRKAMVYGHSMAYPFAPRYKIPHGRSTIIALPQVMEFSCQNKECMRKIARVAETVGVSEKSQSDKENAWALIRSIRTLVHEIYGRLNVPITLKDIGVPKEDLGWMARLCLERWPRPSSPVQATDENILEMYQRIWDGAS